MNFYFYISNILNRYYFKKKISIEIADFRLFFILNNFDQIWIKGIFIITFFFFDLLITVPKNIKKEKNIIIIHTIPNKINIVN
jgi:hypothetical protein